MNKVWDTDHKGITFDSWGFTHALFPFKNYTYALCTRCKEIHTQKNTQSLHKGKGRHIYYTHAWACFPHSRHWGRPHASFCLQGGSSFLALRILLPYQKQRAFRLKVGVSKHKLTKSSFTIFEKLLARARPTRKELRAMSKPSSRTHSH